MSKADQQSKNPDDLYVQSLLLAKVVIRTLHHRANLKVSAEPELKKVPIVDFMKRMRVGSLDKFESRAYISYISFYKNDHDKRGNKALGAIILYIDEDYICYLFKRLGYPDMDEGDEDGLKDACGTLCNIFAGLFRQGLIQLGYSDLMMSHFSSYINEVPEGVGYDQRETDKYEIGFDISGERRMFVDVTLGTLPKVKSS